MARYGSRAFGVLSPPGPGHNPHPFNGLWEVCMQRSRAVLQAFQLCWENPSIG